MKALMLILLLSVTGAEPLAVGEMGTVPSGQWYATGRDTVHFYPGPVLGVLYSVGLNETGDTLTVTIRDTSLVVVMRFE